MAAAQGRSESDPDATVTIAFGKKAILRQTPKVWPLVCIALLAVVCGGWAVRRNLRLHAAEPVLCSATGAPVSAARVAAEDTFMVVAATVCLLCFAASNTMTGASVLLGERLNTYSFSMWNTVTDLWRAGLVPLSVCVFIFSGVYPYVKLLSLVYFTVVLQRPTSTRLALIDVLGKFSLIDTFALMVMVSGLEIHAVARVTIHAGFFLFLTATVASIALGNYATMLYRRGTSHRVIGGDDAASATAAAGSSDGYVQVPTQDITPAAEPAAPPLATPAVTSASSAAATAAPPTPLESSWWHRRGVAVLPFLVVHLCSLPAWVRGCLRYTVGGVARLLTPPQKMLSLWQLGCLNTWGKTPLFEDWGVVFILQTALTTILLAPCFFALMPKRAPFLASWCAADVFVVACVAGLLQLHQFVTFVLGDGMDDIYTAHATLLWPMLPLTVASLVVWYLILRDVIGIMWLRK